MGINKSIIFSVLLMVMTLSAADAAVKCTYKRVGSQYSTYAISEREDDLAQIYAWNRCADAQHYCTITCVPFKSVNQ